jgi:hypothetical protein
MRKGVIAMQKKSKKPDNSIKVIIEVNGERNEAVTLDSRKYELINYYVQQKKDGEATPDTQMKQLIDTVSASLNEVIDTQYKKYVPKAVREMYDGFLSQSLSFGALPTESESKPDNAENNHTLSAKVQTTENENHDVSENNG